MIARAHTEAHDDGHLLPGHLAAADLEELHTMMPPGLTSDPARVVGSPPECLGWWWSSADGRECKSARSWDPRVTSFFNVLSR